MKTSNVIRALDTIMTMEKQPMTPFLIGSPGIGKSDIVRQLAEKHGYEKVLDIRLSQHDSTDVKGIPQNIDNSLQWLAPDFMPVKGSKWEGTKGVLFFDELNRAQPEVMQTVFEIVLDRSIGMKPILDDWFIIAAGNYGYEDDTDVYDMDSALKNRFMMIDMDIPTIDEWLIWAKNNNINNYIQSFLKNSPKYLYMKEEDFLVTPRSWEKFSNILNNNVGQEKNITMLFGKTIINNAHNAFYNYLESLDVINGEDILKRYKSVKEKLNYQERNDIHRINESLVQYISSLKKENIMDRMLKNFYDYFEKYLNDDNKVALIINLRDNNCELFLDKIFEKYDSELNDEGSYLNKLIKESLE